MTNIILALSSLLSGFLIHLALVSSGEKWADNFHYRITFTLLPFVALVISKIIAGNIALSLGMVGALSIVRFRNPVKNPFELTMYFALLTLGITLGVKLQWGLGFSITIISIVYFSKFIKKNQSVSFQEGREVFTLEIKSKNKLENLLDNKNLKNYSEYNDENNNKNYNYFFCYNSKEEVLIEAKKFKNQDAEIQINL